MYKVFNQLKGQYDLASDLEHAKTLYSDNYNAFIAPRVQSVTTHIPSQNQVWNTDVKKVEKFYEDTFKVKSAGRYTGTGFNLDTEETLFREVTFDNPLTVTKIDNSGNITDLIRVFDANDLEGIGYYGYVIDLNDPYNRVAKYKVIRADDGDIIFSKRDYKTDEIMSETSMTHGKVPSKYAAVLDKYPQVKNNILAHGQRPHGYIVYYHEKVDLIDNPIYNNTVEQIKQEAFKHINVIFETINSDGHIITEVVDTANWLE